MMLQGQGDASNKEEAPIEKLLEMWLSEKTMNYPYRNDFTEIEKRKWEKSIRELRWRRDLLAKFFADSNVKYVSGLGGGLDAKYIKWRGDKKFDGRKANTLTGDETIKREVCILRQLTDMAAREGWETRPNTFKTKVKRGLKKKVRAYEYAEQKRILEKFAGNGLYHDAALFLLVTGIRVSEFETLMHAKAWDGSRMMHIPGTKTESADREIPVCDTMRKLWERGYIFKANAQSFQGAMKKLKIQEFKPNKDGEISATHSLRHSYVVNKLKAGISSNYVQEWSGHSAAEFTKGRYGKFNRKDMSEDYDKDIADAKAHLDWLENHYFE